MSRIGSIFPIFLALAAVTITISYGHSLGKRDLEDIGDAINNEIPRGSLCATDDQCSFVEVCNIEGLSFHCELAPWFIWTLVALAIIGVLSLAVSCVCCPCCCLYAMCRKG